MKQLDDLLRLSATDLANHLGCEHLTALDQAVATGDLVMPVWNDPALDALRERGFAHERDPRQMQLANALCRYLELSTVVTL